MRQKFGDCLFKNVAAPNLFFFWNYTTTYKCEYLRKKTIKINEKKICKLQSPLYKLSKIWQNLANFGPRTAGISWNILTYCHRYCYRVYLHKGHRTRVNQTLSHAQKWSIIENARQWIPFRNRNVGLKTAYFRVITGQRRDLRDRNAL